MSARAIDERSGVRLALDLAVDALRGIGRRHVYAAVLFGLTVSSINAVTFLTALTRFAERVPLPGLVATFLLQEQIHAFALMAAVVIADRFVDAGVPMRRVYLTAAIGGSTLGVALSSPVFWLWRQSVAATAWPPSFTWLQGSAVYVYQPVFDLTHWLLIGGAAVFLYADRRAARRTEARLHASQLDRIRRSKVALESRLQAMQARVEPQFLFNTLAQVERLFEIDAPIAARMLDDLIAYLRAAMPLMRDTSSTVAQEVELVRAYLDIVRLRLGDRLRVSIDVPPDVGGARMPPMMLLPLIDHTVVRGLGPASQGGAVRIAAHVAGGRLRLSIVDSGAAIVPDADATGLDAIRQRLDALYAGDASLVLHRDGDHANEAVLDLPLERAVAFSAASDRNSS